MSLNKKLDESFLIVIIFSFFFIVIVGLIIANIVTRIDLFSFPVEDRSIQEVEGISPLWNREWNFEYPRTSSLQIFTPVEDIMVFVSSDALHAVNMITGETVWETMIPELYFTVFYDDMFFVTSLEPLEEPPIEGNLRPPRCSFTDDVVSLSTYDPLTGERIWGYNYHSVHGGTHIPFKNGNVYLTGGANHGYDRSLAKIDIESGRLLSLQCTEWPQEPVLPPSAADEGIFWPPDNIVSTEREMSCTETHPLFVVVEDTARLNILEGDTKEILGYVKFSGKSLDPFSVEVVVQGDLAVIHLDDSNQFFGFRFWNSFPLHD